MSKRELKKYLAQLPKEELEEQIVALYDKFIPVKTYYDFVFNPKEDKLINDAKLKISDEYFPVKRKRPKMRRSVAQKFIKHFISLGVDNFLIADVMFFTIEVAMKFSSKRNVFYESFFKSIQTAYDQAVSFIIEKGIHKDFEDRVNAIKQEAIRQDWNNKFEFINTADRIEY
jgi:hypothetical protein